MGVKTVKDLLKFGRIITPLRVKCVFVERGEEVLCVNNLKYIYYQHSQDMLRYKYEKFPQETKTSHEGTNNTTP
jgi:hypothetical protein